MTPPPAWFSAALDAPVHQGTTTVDGASIAYRAWGDPDGRSIVLVHGGAAVDEHDADRKSTRLNSSHSQISYAVFCLKKKKEHVLDVGADTPLRPRRLPCAGRAG